MIVHWTSVSLDEFQATWEGENLHLVRVNGWWRLRVSASRPGEVLVVNGKPEVEVIKMWLVARLAMIDIDKAMTKIISKKMANLKHSATSHNLELAHA